MGNSNCHPNPKIKGSDNSRTIATSSNSKSKPPFLIVENNNKFCYVWDDDNSKADAVISVWRPLPPEGYANLGDLVYAQRVKPPGSIPITYVYDDPAYCKKPVDYQRVWVDKGSHASEDSAIWLPLSGDSNYVALGHVFSWDRNNKPPVDACRVVHINYASRTDPKINMWNINADVQAALCKNPHLHTFFVSTGSLSCDNYPAPPYAFMPAEVKLNCCMKRESGGYDRTLCGERYWGSTGNCDDFMRIFCQANPTAPECSCLNAVDNFGRPIPQPQCFYNKCIENGYWTTNMKETQDCATVCNQIVDIGGSENVYIDSSKFIQYCGTNNNGSQEPEPTDSTTNPIDTVRNFINNNKVLVLAGGGGASSLLFFCCCIIMIVLLASPTK